MKKFILKDSENRPFYKLTLEEVDSHYISGFAEEIVSWGKDCVFDTYETLYFADFYIKWDGCSHWNFRGEDYCKESKEIDSYYHICGAYSYKNFIIGLLFVFDVASKYISRFDSDEIGIYKQFNQLLNDYIIEEVE